MRSPVEQIAAVVHDAIEDTDLAIDDLVKAGGRRCAVLCELLAEGLVRGFSSGRTARARCDDVIGIAYQISRSINGVNLHENILPTRERARLVLEDKGTSALAAVPLCKL